MPTIQRMEREMYGLSTNYVRRLAYIVGSGGRAVKCRTVNRGDDGATAVSKLGQFRLPHICLCLSEETLKAGWPLYLVSMPGEVKDPTMCNLFVDSVILEKNSCVSPSLGCLEKTTGLRTKN